ncbi:hypothetical protein SAMN06264348_105201 [Oceanospirillum linum]|nr:hypothetical protein SAMN04489856_106202 [Oleiphilus messinensis]SMP25495.1 hypothetical protein SAMN06264348_105201 [Oceanospirillum linum]
MEVLVAVCAEYEFLWAVTSADTELFIRKGIILFPYADQRFLNSSFLREAVFFAPLLEYRQWYSLLSAVGVFSEASVSASILARSAFDI